ncbi:AaceriAGL251Cp [[Ashbya] aceris (nom. inval.)]|nr:AaceriAGL251Cp [[Ashbya] aceris (nom. inval.)]
MFIDDVLIHPGGKSEALLKLNRLGGPEVRKLLRSWLVKFPPVDQTIELDELENDAKLIDVAIGQLWPGGLNCYQLAQLDVACLVADKTQMSWAVSAVCDKDGKETVVAVDFRRFGTELREQVGQVHTCHVYSEMHAKLPLVLYRVQLFDSYGSQLVTHKAFFAALPLRYKVVLHSAQKDVHSRYIFQCVTQALQASCPGVQLQLTAGPIKDILTNIDRAYGTSVVPGMQGVWSSYLHRDIEPSPLHSPTKHPVVVGKRKRDDDDDLSFRQKCAMVRFKGTTSGVKSLVRYLDKRHRQRVYSVADGQVHDSSEDEEEINKYQSLVPVRKVEFTVKNSTSLSFKLKLRGKDVFAGMHELCDKQFLDINRLPGWLTGENGAESGIVEDGNFKRIKRGGLI